MNCLDSRCNLFDESFSVAYVALCRYGSWITRFSGLDSREHASRQKFKLQFCYSSKSDVSGVRGINTEEFEKCTYDRAELHVERYAWYFTISNCT